MAYQLKDRKGNELIINKGKLGYKITVLREDNTHADFHISYFDWELFNFLAMKEYKGE